MLFDCLCWEGSFSDQGSVFNSNLFQGGGVMSELGRIFFQNSNLTVNLTPALIVLAVLLLGEIYGVFTSI